MSQDTSSSKTSSQVDRAGAFASMLCALHCASAAFIPAALSAMGLGAFLGHEAEWVFTIIAIGFAATAAFVGWRRHRSVLIVALLGLGIAGLLASRFIEMGSGHDHGHGHGHEVAATHEGEHEDEHHDEHHGHGEEKHHGDEHGEHAKHDDHAGHDAHAKHDDHADHDEHEGGFDSHLLGTIIGILAGILLVAGHVAGLRANNRPMVS